MLVLLFVALWFILRGGLFYVLPCVILFLCFSVLLALRLPRMGKRELILMGFFFRTNVRLFDWCLFGFVGFLFLLVSGKGCGLWLWHSLDFSLTFFCFISYLVLFLFLCFSVPLALRLPRLGKRELILVLFVRCSICAFFLSVSSSSWCLGRALVCDCGTPWTFLLPFLNIYFFGPCGGLLTLSRIITGNR